MKKYKTRTTTVDVRSSFGRTSSTPALSAAPELNTGRRTPLGDEQKNVNYNSDEGDRQNMTGRTSSVDFTFTDQDNTIFPVRATVASTPFPPVVSCTTQDSRHLAVEPAPSRIARKASKIGSNIVSDVKAGSASLLGGMRRSRQSEMVDSNREQMEMLGNMSILSTDCVVVGELGKEVGEKQSLNGYAFDKEGQTARFGYQPSTAHTKGIMKKPTTCSETQKRSSRSIMNPKMVDSKPSVRFTLDLPPKLDLDLSLSGSIFDKGLERSTLMEEEVQLTLTSGSWAKRTAAAVLNKSRGVEIDAACAEKYVTMDREKDIKVLVDMPQSVERGDPTTSNVICSKNSTILCPTEDVVTAAERHALNIGQTLTLNTLEPPTIHCLEDLANIGSRKLSSRQESSVYGSAPSPVSARNSSDPSDSMRR